MDWAVIQAPEFSSHGCCLSSAKIQLTLLHNTLEFHWGLLLSISFPDIPRLRQSHKRKGTSFPGLKNLVHDSALVLISWIAFGRVPFSLEIQIPYSENEDNQIIIACYLLYLIISWKTKMWKFFVGYKAISKCYLVKGGYSLKWQRF